MRFVFLALSFSLVAFSQQRPIRLDEMPDTRKVDHIDTYHGVKVADPYRWLEDDRSAETGEWVKAQNSFTEQYFAKFTYREAIRKRLATVMNYPKFGLPVRRGEMYYFTKNDGLQNQSVWYAQKGLKGRPEVLIDPNKLSSDGTASLAIMAFSSNGKYLAYGISRGGSDWHEGYVLDLTTKKLLAEKLEWIKASDFAWARDSFFYSRYPAPEKGKELVGQNAFHTVYLHQVGTPQSKDELIFEDKVHPLRYHNVGMSTDERFAVMSVEDPSTGKKGNALHYFEMKSKSRKFLPIVDEISEDRFSLADNVGDLLLIQSNRGAPLGKLVAFETRTGKFRDKPVVAETKDSLSAAWTAGGKLFLSYSKDVADHLYQHRLDGSFEAKLKLPGTGTVGVGPGLADDKDLFYLFTNLNSPATIYRYSIASRESEVFEQPKIPGYDPNLYETSQVFYKSKDGTRVPMSLIHKKGLVLNGKNPTLLYAYGGFNVSSVPFFSSLRLALLEQGFVYAVANIRGGGEYGENWHEQGTKLKKQNVFDDFIAAAEWLISSKYTSSEKLAINGGSNGGLLVGAVINQRPDLYRAAVPQVGVMDMLRFHKFTLGSGWIGDYGSSDNAEDFKALYAYSPLHNIKPQVKYPAVLVTSADHDDRVVPAHSFKYAAAMQDKVSKERSVLIRIGTNSGHGASSLGKAMEEIADVYCFLMKELGVEPKF